MYGIKRSKPNFQNGRPFLQSSPLGFIVRDTREKAQDVLDRVGLGGEVVEIRRRQASDPPSRPKYMWGDWIEV